MPNMFADFTLTVVAGGASGIGTTLLAADTKVYLPAGFLAAHYPTVYPFPVLLGSNAAFGSGEVVSATGSPGTDQLTIVRNIDGTNQAWAVGSSVQMSITSQTMNALNALYNVILYGADPTGTNDSTTAIQNAIAAAGTAGGGVVYLPTGTYKVSSTITIGNGTSGVASTVNGVTVRGDGIYATSIKWNGSSGGQIAAITGVCTGNMFTDLTLDGNSGLAGYGLYVTSGQYANCPSIRVWNTSIAGMYFTVWTPASPNSDTIGLHFGKVLVQCSAGTISVQSHGIWLNGGVGAGQWDTTQCTFENVSVWAQQNYNTALRWSLCDFNYFGVFNGFFSSTTGHFGLVIDGNVLANYPQNNYVALANFGGAFSSSGTFGTNYVGLYDTNDNAGAAPGLGSGLVGLAEPQGAETQPYPFGSGAYVSAPGEALNSQITTTSATNVVTLNLPIAGLYLACLNYRVVTAATTLTAVAKATDDSGSAQSFFFFSTAAAGTGDFAVNGGSQSVGSYTCPPIVLRYSGSGTVPTITVTAGTANQVFCSASILKIG